MSFTRRTVALGALAGAAIVAGGRGPARAAAPAAIPDPQATGPGGIDLAGMDRAVAPGDDFYRYVNGAWLKSTPIPSDQGRLTEFGRLADLNTLRCRALLQAAAATPTTDEARKLGDLYASFMDEAAIEAKGIEPLRADLDRIAAIAAPADLAGALAALSRDWLRPLPGGGSPMPPAPIATGVAVDAKQPTRILPHLQQGGVGLPDRDYYLIDSNPGFVAARAAYRQHLAAMFALVGLSAPQERAQRATPWMSASPAATGRARPSATPTSATICGPGPT